MFQQLVWNKFSNNSLIAQKEREIYMNDKKNSTPNLTQLVREEIQRKKLEKEQEEIKKAVEDTKENFRKIYFKPCRRFSYF